MKLSILFLALPSLSFAADYCEPIATVRAKINYCDENSGYVPPAQACREKFKTAVKTKTEGLGKTLAENAKKAKEDQRADFKAIQSMLAATEAMLDDLISQGMSVLQEVDLYQEDFVLPVYAGYEEDFKKDPHDPAVQKEFRGSECYGEAMEDLDDVKTDVYKLMHDLEKTRDEALKLHVYTETKQASLGGDSASLPSSGKGEGGKAGAPVNGSSKNTPSTITGVEEQKKKDAEAPSN